MREGEIMYKDYGNCSSEQEIIDNDKMVTEASGGKKADGGKIRWSLLLWDSLIPVVRVLMFGASKYGEENWQKVSSRRYRDALLRHILTDEEIDSETGEPHYAHAICCLLFLLWLKKHSGNRS